MGCGLPMGRKRTGAPRPDRARRARGRRVALVGVLGAAVLLASCSSPADPGPRVQQWVTDNDFGSTIGTLLTDGTRVDKVISGHPTSGALKAACGVLESDAGTAGGVLPTPDQQLTNTLRDAVADELAAAGRCYGAAPTATAVLQTSERDITKADALLEEAVQQISSLTGQVPSTKTTSTPDVGNGDPFGF
jgi:hypothetical protein